MAGGGGITGVGVNALLGQFQKQTGLDLRKDVLGWMGDAGVFVGGTTSADLGGALVIKTTDPAKTKRTMTVLERFARQQSDTTKIRSLHASGIDAGFTAQNPTGPAVQVALAGDRFVVAIGGKGVLAQAIKPGQQLGSAPAFTAAAGKLGNGLRPSFYLDFTQVAKLIESFAGHERRLPAGQALPRHLRRDRRRRQGRGLGRHPVTLRRDAALDPQPLRRQPRALQARLDLLHRDVTGEVRRAVAGLDVAAER